MSTIISAQMVNELRTATGAGLLDCKKALTESNGDVAAAVTLVIFSEYQCPFRPARRRKG